MSLEFIVAFDRHYAIGRAGENRLPWHIPSDLQRFKKLTIGHRVVMGRRTWESLPDAVRPLPGRENFVLSRRRDYRADGAQVVHSVDEVLDMHQGGARVMVIGGGEIFRLFLPHAQRIHCTLVDADINSAGGNRVIGNSDGRLRFPFSEVLDNTAWREDKTHRIEKAQHDEQDEYQTAYQCWKRQTALRVTLPQWLRNLRQDEITRVVENDPRSSDSLPILGLNMEQAKRVIDYGQADFDRWCQKFSPEDLVCLYAYCYQKRHLQELIAVLRKLCEKNGTSTASPIVIDLGCGPFTGGLAISKVFNDNDLECDYIGWDKSNAMLMRGEQLAHAVRLHPTGKGICHAIKSWDLTDANCLADIVWDKKHEKRPIIVIVSYLLKSETLDVGRMLHDLLKLLNKINHSTVQILYTNSISPDANRKYPTFKALLQKAGFEQEKIFEQAELFGEDEVRIEILGKYPYVSEMRCALFQRDAPADTCEKL